MASSVLHIKDSYYFEVPKVLWRSNYGAMAGFPDVWIRLDAEFQLWEAERLYEGIGQTPGVPAWEDLRREYLVWRGKHRELQRKRLPTPAARRKSGN